MEQDKNPVVDGENGSGAHLEPRVDNDEDHGGTFQEKDISKTSDKFESNQLGARSHVTDQIANLEETDESDSINSNNMCYIFDKNEAVKLKEKGNDVSETQNSESIPSDSGDEMGQTDIQDTTDVPNMQSESNAIGELSETHLPSTEVLEHIDSNTEATQIESKTDVQSEKIIPEDSSRDDKDNNNCSNVRCFGLASAVDACAKDDVNDIPNSSCTSKGLLNLNLPCQSPETDGRGVSPEIICFTHLSPTALYGKEQLSTTQLLSRPSSLNTPDPVLLGDSDSSCCPTPFIYTSSECMHAYNNSLYTSNENVQTSVAQFTENNYSYTLSEDPITYSETLVRGQKRKVGEIHSNNIETDHNNNATSKVTSNMSSFSNKVPDLAEQMYQYQGRPPDVSAWTAVNSGLSKYGLGFGTNFDQNCVNNLTRDPFLFSYQHPYSECGYNYQLNGGQCSSKPTCAVPPYLLNHTQTSGSYSSYKHIACENQPVVSHQFNIPSCGSIFPNSSFDLNENTRASCQFAANQNIDINNNIQFGTSSACCRLDFSSPVSQEQYPNPFPVPTFVSAPSYISGLNRPEPVFPNLNAFPYSTANRRPATCTSTYSRPTSAMSTHSDNGTETPSIDLTNVSSDDELVVEKGVVTESSKSDINKADKNEALQEHENVEVSQEKNNGEVLQETNDEDLFQKADEVTWSTGNMVVPMKVGNAQLMCPLTDLKSKTVKELIQSVENKSESDGETNASSSTQSCSSPPPAHQNGSESFAAEFIRQRKTKSPISAFCAALDLSKPKKKERPILPHPQPLCMEPAIPITSLLNVHGPTLAFSGSMMVPYLQTVCTASARLGNMGTVSGVSNTPSQASVLGFTQYSPSLMTSSLQYLPYVGVTAATVPMTQLPASNDPIPNINLSSVPLPLYASQLQQLKQTSDQPQNANQIESADQAKQQVKQYLCKRSIGVAAPVTTSTCTSIKLPRKRLRNRKSAAASIAPPAATVAAYTASIQGSHMTTTGPEPPKDVVTYYPTPARIGEAARSDSGKRVFKARHSNFSILRIGTFQYTCPTISYEKVARVKFLYSKKKLLYEFQLNDLESATVTPHRRLTEIEIPFNTVVGLWLYDREMRLEVNTPPTMCLGSKILEKHTKYGVHAPPVYDREQLVDLTDGQLRTVPYHYVQFKSCCGEKLKTEMGQFDSRFSVLLRSPLIEDPYKSLKPVEVPITSHLLDPVKPKGKGGRNKSCAGCKCETGCSSHRCMCCVRGGTCTEGECLCINCRNPLNILHQLGLPVYRARTDPCLMENIYQIKKLECYVKIQLILDCCQIPLTLLQCIPGTFTCPSIGCGVKYTYSWCSAHLCNEDVAPRNHCIKCGRCTDYRNRHCELCNICYFAGESGSFKCPVCHNGLEEENFELDSSTDTED